MEVEGLTVNDLPEGFVDWAAQQLGCAPSQVALAFVAGDASPRRYYRVTTSADAITRERSKGPHSGDSRIAMVSPASENNEAFLHVSKKFAEFDLRTPEVWAQSLAKGWFLLEDFGDQLLLPVLSASASASASAAASGLYQSALNTLATLAAIPCDGSDIPIYDIQRLRSEFAIFPEWFLSGLLNINVDDEAQERMENLSEYLGTIFNDQPIVWVHRDFHSRNLMLLDDGDLGVIDFQDAVLGPITYDPASILKDCYIRLPRHEQLHLLDCHLEQLKAIDMSDLRPPSRRTQDLATELAEISAEQFQRWFDLTGLQRHLRVLGVFARLHLRDNKSGYLADLPLVIEYVREALTLTLATHKSVAEFKDWFELDVMPVISEQPWYTPIDPEGWVR